MKYFWEYPISGDAAAHARRGVGPATDYETPRGTTVHAPFSGRVYPYQNAAGGLSVRIVGAKYEAHMQHLSNNTLVKSGALRLWRTRIAVTGNTGVSSGPHVHAYVIIRRTGRRVSFSSWLRSYVHKGKPSRLPLNTRKFLGLR